MNNRIKSDRFCAKLLERERLTGEENKPISLVNHAQLLAHEFPLLKVPSCTMGNKLNAPVMLPSWTTAPYHSRQCLWPLSRKTCATHTFTYEAIPTHSICPATWYSCKTRCYFWFFTKNFNCIVIKLKLVDCDDFLKIFFNFVFIA